MSPILRFAAGLSEHPEPVEAIAEVIGEIEGSLDGPPTLAVLFVTGHHTEALPDLVDTVRAVLRPRTLLGATAVSVVGGAREVEDRAGVSLWAASLAPGAAHPLRLEARPGGSGIEVEGVPGGEPAGTLLVLADPFTFPVDALLSRLAADAPGVAVIGGLASAAGTAGLNRLVLDGEVHRSGAVGVLLDGELATVVSQGCRPIGSPFIITRAERNHVLELGGRPAVERLEELVAGATDAERELMAGGLHAGLVIDEGKLEFTRGDFLIRGVLGLDSSTGAIAVGDRVEVGTTMQFHVRDAATADEDLRSLMAGRSAESALLFTCNGRGRHLFATPDHDASIVHEAIGRGPVAGMFCAGEVGPIGRRSFLHGFTASVLLFGR